MEFDRMRSNDSIDLNRYLPAEVGRLERPRDRADSRKYILSRRRRLTRMGSIHSIGRLIELFVDETKDIDVM